MDFYKNRISPSGKALSSNRFGKTETWDRMPSMPFVTKNSAGEVIGVHRVKTPGASVVRPGDPALLEFLMQSANRESRGSALDESDHDMSRVVEDLIELMIEKRMISLGELPPAAQEKVLKRQELRGDLKWMSNLVGEEKAM